MENRLELVCGLKYGDQFFKIGDVVVFSVKEDAAYRGKLYDMGHSSFIAHGDNGEEYNFLYDDIEKMELFKG